MVKCPLKPVICSILIFDNSPQVFYILCKTVPTVTDGRNAQSIIICVLDELYPMKLQCAILESII
jgi:hypothetical protein